MRPTRNQSSAIISKLRRNDDRFLSHEKENELRVQFIAKHQFFHFENLHYAQLRQPCAF